MSASLVGSEMCIRDSQKQQSPPAQSACRPSAVHRMPTLAPQRMHEAVSYTHLTLPTICSV
eukprot:3539195-Alexandrium_andersonii.AAC.1